MNNRFRRPTASLYPDFGMALWDSPERNVRLIHRFSYEMLLDGTASPSARVEKSG
jgi:hypothetical protein